LVTSGRLGAAVARSRAESGSSTNSICRPSDARWDSFDFRSAYIEHSHAVFSMAAKICGKDWAADVTQEVFLALWNRPERFDSTKGTLRALLVTMGHHKAVDLIRAGAARKSRERSDALSGRIHGDKEFGVFYEEHADRVTQALMTLSEARRDAIVIAFYGGCSYVETAIVLDQPEGTIKARIRAGLSQMRTLLETGAEPDGRG
jgi:RNA polymerase sigma-70 factor (ECF subfamily)